MDFTLSWDAYARRIINEPSNHELSRKVLRPYLEDCEALGDAEAEAALQQLIGFLNASPPSFATFNAWYRLAERAKERGDKLQALSCFRRMLSDYDQGVTKEVLEDPKVSRSTKVLIEYSVGYAYQLLGRDDEALAQYERVQSVYPPPEDRIGTGKDDAVYFAGVGTAKVLCRKHADDPTSGIAAWQAFLKRWPNNPRVREAELEMGKLYEKQGTVPSAVECYERVIESAPNSVEANQARERLGVLNQATTEPVL